MKAGASHSTISQNEKVILQFYHPEPGEMYAHIRKDIKSRKKFQFFKLRLQKNVLQARKKKTFCFDVKN